MCWLTVYQMCLFVGGLSFHVALTISPRKGGNFCFCFPVPENCFPSQFCGEARWRRRRQSKKKVVLPSRSKGETRGDFFLPSPPSLPGIKLGFLFSFSLFSIKKFFKKWKIKEANMLQGVISFLDLISLKIWYNFIFYISLSRSWRLREQGWQVRQLHKLEVSQNNSSRFFF